MWDYRVRNTLGNIRVVDFKTSHVWAFFSKLSDEGLAQQKKLLKFVEQSKVEIGGRSGFIFNTRHGRPIMPARVNSFLKNIVNAYNKKETILAANEKREPEFVVKMWSNQEIECESK